MLKAGEWHIPFGDNIRGEILDIQRASGYAMSLEEIKIKISTARCARISYNNFEGNDDYAADIKLYSTLLNKGHFSPFEHCARVMSNEEYSKFYITTPDEINTGYSRENYFDVDWIQEGWCKNFRGFIQQRYFLETENN